MPGGPGRVVDVHLVRHGKSEQNERMEAAMAAMAVGQKQSASKVIFGSDI